MDMGSIFEQIKPLSPLDPNITVLVQALGCFERCICMPEIYIGDNAVVELIFRSGLLLLLADNCLDCKNEIRWWRNEGSVDRKLLLITEEKQRGEFFKYADVILVQGGKLWRLDIPLASGRKFLPFHQASKLFVQGKLIDLGGRTMQAFIYDCPPLVRYVGRKGVYWGVEIDLMSAMTRALNFKVNYTEIDSPDVWGREINGSWVGGIIGTISSGQNDIGLCGVWVKQPLMKYADIIPYEEVLIYIAEISLGFTISNIPVEEKWKSIYSPLSWGLWTCVIVTVVASIAAMYLLSKLSGHREKLVDWVFLVFGQFIGCCSLPSEGPVPFRAAGTVIAIAALMFTSLYSSAILSHLTKPPIIPQPETVRELVTKGYYWSRSRPVFNPGAILNEEDEWQRKFIKRYRNMSEMGPAFKNRRFAFYLSNIGHMFLWRDLPRYSYNTSNDTIIVQLKEVISSYPIGIAVRKGSVLTEHFTLIMRRLLSSGIINKIRREKEHFVRLHWISRLAVEHGPEPLTLDALQGAFFIMVLGIALSILVFIGEILNSKRYKAKVIRIERQ